MSNRIQYYHSHGKFVFKDHTVCLEVPSVEILFDLLVRKLGAPETGLAMLLGVTIVNPKDHYCYKTGREKSQKHSWGRHFNLETVRFTEDSTIFKLTTTEFAVYLETKPEWSKPHFINFNFTRE